MYDPLNHGFVNAWIYTSVVDLNGNKRQRRINIGREYMVSLETAKEMVENARVNNQPAEVCAEFKIAL